MIDLIETYQETNIINDYNATTGDYVISIALTLIMFFLYMVVIFKLTHMMYRGKLYALPSLIFIILIGTSTAIYLTYHPDMINSIPAKIRQNNKTNTTTTKTHMNNEISDDKYEITLSKDNKYLVLKPKNNSNIKFQYTVNGNKFDLNNNILEIKDETRDDFVISVHGVSNSTHIATTPKDKFKIKKETV